ncbi:MAG: super-infection exclusion protein B [Bacteroidetes bacterium]|nr:super-infection exclusion protein B [Bacteroidota bacterium]
MNDSKKNKGILWLGFLLSLLILLLSNALSWLDDSDYNWILSRVPYKWQLTIWVMIILSLVFSLLYNKIFFISKVDYGKQELKNESVDVDNQLTGTNNGIMENLSSAEAAILMIFLDENSKVIKLKYDSLAKVLMRNGVLRCLKYDGTLPKQEIMIEEWAWEWVNRNKEKLKAKI